MFKGRQLRNETHRHKRYVYGEEKEELTEAGKNGSFSKFTPFKRNTKDSKKKKKIKKKRSLSTALMSGLSHRDLAPSQVTKPDDKQKKVTTFKAMEVRQV